MFITNGIYLSFCIFFFSLSRALYVYMQCGSIPSVVFRFSKIFPAQGLWNKLEIGTYYLYFRCSIGAFLGWFFHSRELLASSRAVGTRWPSVPGCHWYVFPVQGNMHWFLKTHGAVPVVVTLDVPWGLSCPLEPPLGSTPNAPWQLSLLYSIVLSVIAQLAFDTSSWHT